MFEILSQQSPFFNPEAPVLCRKPSAHEAPDCPGLRRVHWKFNDRTFISTFYTGMDQAVFLWGVLCLLMFGTAQFAAIDWRTQAAFWSILTMIGTIAMIQLADFYLRVEPLRQAADSWIALMLLGLAITDLGVFCGWSFVLINLCPLWLGLSAIAYLYCGMRLRSRAFCVSGLIHLAAIFALPYVSSWQFLATGLVLGLNSIVLAEWQWDSHKACATHSD